MCFFILFSLLGYLAPCGTITVLIHVPPNGGKLKQNMIVGDFVLDCSVYCVKLGIMRTGKAEKGVLFLYPKVV